MQSRTDFPMSADGRPTPPALYQEDTYYQTPPRVEFDNYKASYFLM